MQWISILLIAALCNLAAAQPHQQLQALEFKQAATINGPWVTLGDVAGITPEDAPADIAHMRLMPAPPPGNARTVTLGYLKVRMRRAGLQLHNIQLTGAKTMQIIRPAAAAPDPPPTAENSSSSAERQPPSLPPGTNVTILVRKGTLVIETPGTLLARAAIGETARVRVTQTNARIEARIIDDSTVEVNL